MVQINSSQRGKLPPVSPPVTFHAKDGQLRGWKASLPDGHPLATPAVMDGQVFLGGGFGSYELPSTPALVGWAGSTRPPTMAV